jgi:Bacterial PH domain
MPLQLINYRCPHCRRRIALDENEIGADTRCPYSDCRKPIHADSEDVVSEGTLATVHPAMWRAHPLVAAGLWGMFAVGLFALWRSSGNPTVDWLDQAVGRTAGAILAAGAALALFAWWLMTRCTSLEVTTERSLCRRGVLSRESSEVRHCDVRNLQVHQTLYQRLVGIGELSISSAGQEDMEIVVRGIPHPHDIAGAIRDRQ